MNHDQIKLVEVLEGSDYSEYVNHLAQAQGDETKALETYRKALPSGDGKAEKMRKVENAADLERQREAEKADAKGGKTTVAKNDAPAAKPAAE